MTVLKLSLIFIWCCGANALRLATAKSNGSQAKVMIVTVAKNMDTTMARNDEDTRQSRVSNFGGEANIRANRECYAAVHGYETFTLDSESEQHPEKQQFVSDLPFVTEKQKSDARWLKVRMIKKLMDDRPDIEWLAWIDGDAVIVDYTRSMDDFLMIAGPNHHMILPSSRQGCLWSSNHFIVRNSAEGRALVNRWLGIAETPCIFRRMYAGCTFGDQCHMWAMANETLYDLFNPPKAEIAEEAGSTEGLETITESFGRTHRLDLDGCSVAERHEMEESEGKPNAERRAVLGAWNTFGKDEQGVKCNKAPPNTKHRTMGPFVFAAYDYLMHDCAHGNLTDLARSSAFIVHKPRSGCLELYESQKCPLQ